MASVVIRDVVKRFGDTTILHGVSVDIADGEFAVLVGPSGCGKTTLLRMIAGLEEINSGSIAIGGREINIVPPKERDIAMVFQNYALYPHMSVFDNMAFSLKLAKVPRGEMEKKVARAAEILGLQALLDRYPRQLSGGQRQRVAMGRAIVRNPKVFLFDEPLSNLDAKLRVQMRTEIRELHQKLKSTSIYVTHDQIEAMTMADKIVVMRDGHIQQVGTPLELYDWPANVFVAGFIGSPAMNFLPATALEGGMRVRQASGDELAASVRGANDTGAETARRPAPGVRAPGGGRRGRAAGRAGHRADRSRHHADLPRRSYGSRDRAARTHDAEGWRAGDVAARPRKGPPVRRANRPTRGRCAPGGLRQHPS